ncbi:hypothetical protein MD484_g8631, partial [Candolleomyces efflorescens]
MATVAQRTRRRAAATDAEVAPQPDALTTHPSGPAATAAGDVREDAEPTPQPRTYASVVSSPTSSRSSSPLFSPRTANEPSLRDDSHVPETRVSGSANIRRDHESPRPTPLEAERPTMPTRSSMMSRETNRDPNRWDVVPPGRRTRSLESIRPEERVVQFDTRNRYAPLPPVELHYHRDVRNDDDVLAQAERMLTPDQRNAIHRRFDRVNTSSFREPNRAPDLSKRLQDKGKGPDPRNWGDLDARDDELEPDVQRAVHDSYRNAPRRQEDTYPVASSSRVHNRYTPTGHDDHRGVIPSRFPSVQPSDRSNRSDRRENAPSPITQIGRNSTLGILREREQGFEYNDPDRPHHPPGRAPDREPSDPGDDESDGYHGHRDDRRRPHFDPRRGRGGIPYRQRAQRHYDEDGHDYRPPQFEPPQYRMTLPTPKHPYDGSADLEKYTEFRDDCRRMIQLARVHPRDQVELIAPHLEKRARKFYLTRVAPNPGVWSFSEFMDELFNAMFPKDFKVRLREKLNNNVQGNRSVWDYVQDLQTKLDTVGLNDERERIWRLWNGFSAPIQDRLWMDQLYPEHSSWDDIVRSAEAAENGLRVIRRNADNREAQPQRPQGSQSGGRYNPPQRSSSRPPTQMRGQSTPQSSTQTRAVNSTPSSSQLPNQTQSRRNEGVPPTGSRPAIPTMTEAERQDHISSGKCFRCHGFGHIARACPRANLVRSNNVNRPPGMAAFNLEMGYDAPINDSEMQVEEDLPHLSSNSMMIDDPAHAFCHFGRRQQLDEFDHQFYQPPGPCSVETVRHDVHEPSWMVFHDCPTAQPRLYLGDALSMMAEYVLNSSQPYPGDDYLLGQDSGIRGRFGIHAVNCTTYGIYDRLLRESVTVPKYRLEHPNFRLGRYYALHRNRKLKRMILEGEYGNRMCDAYSVVASFLLRDGIRTHYPSQSEDTDPEDRFDVQIWDKSTDTFVINDYDRGKYILIDGSLLKNSRFDLVRWYQVASQGLRGYDKDTYLLPGMTINEEKSSPDESVAPEANQDNQSVLEGIDDDLPDLQSISRSDSSETNSDDLPYIPELDFSDSDDTETFIRSSESLSMDTALTDAMVDALARGTPYPGDPVRRNWFGIRFEALRIDSETYQVFDHLRSEVVSIPVEYLRNPSMNIGLWYAETCATRTDGLDVERAIVRWLDGREPGATVLGRAFERRIEILLNQSVLSNDGGDRDFYERYERFSVIRDPRASENLLVTDRMNETVRVLRSTDAESPDFDVLAWREQEGELEQYRQVLIEDVQFDGPPRLLGSPEEQAYAKIATNHRAWPRVLRRVPGTHHSLRRREQNRGELEKILRDLQSDILVAGIQVPSSAYPAIQRNSSTLKSKAILVPKPLVVVAEVNGQPTRALLDSGSLGDFVSATLVDQLKAKTQNLDRPLDLQLAVQGSRSKVNSTVSLHLKYQGIDEERTFYVINVSQYDLIPSEKSQRRVMKCDEYDRDSAGSVKVVQDRGDGRIQKRFSDRKRWHTRMGDRANWSERNRTVSSDVILLSIA